MAKLMQKKLVISVKKLTDDEIKQLSTRRDPSVDAINTEMLKNALEQLALLRQQNNSILSQMASLRQDLNRSTANGISLQNVPIVLRPQPEPEPEAIAGPSTRNLRNSTQARESISQFTYDPSFPEISVVWLRRRKHLLTREFVREIMRVIFEAGELLNRNATGRRAPVDRTNPNNTAVKSVDPVRCDFIRRKYQILDITYK